MLHEIVYVDINIYFNDTKAENEQCGGPWNIIGNCATGTRCLRQCGKYSLTIEKSFPNIKIFRMQVSWRRGLHIPFQIQGQDLHLLHYSRVCEWSCLVCH